MSEDKSYEGLRFEWYQGQAIEDEFGSLALIDAVDEISRVEELRLLRELETNRRSAVATDDLSDDEVAAELFPLTTAEMEILAALDRHREPLERSHQGA